MGLGVWEGRSICCDTFEINDLEMSQDELAYRCHRITLMFLYESPQDIASNSEAGRMRAHYKASIPPSPALDANRKLIRNISWPEFKTAFACINGRRVSFIFVALHLLYYDYARLGNWRDGLLANQLAAFLGDLASKLDAPAYSCLYGFPTKTFPFEWPASIEPLRHHPPDVLAFHSDRMSGNTAFTFPSIPVLLKLAGLPATYPEIEALLPLTCAILAQNIASGTPICSLLSKRASFDLVDTQSTAYQEVLSYLRTDRSTPVFRLQANWLAAEHTQAESTLARRWMSKTLGKLYAQCALEGNALFLDLKRERVERWISFTLRLAPSILEEHGAAVNNESEVEPYLTQDHIEWIETEVGMAFAQHHRCTEAVKSMRGQQLMDLYKPDAQDKHEDGSVEEIPGNGPFFGAMLYALALQGYSVDLALHLVDIYDLLSVSKPSLSCPLLLALSLQSVGKQNDDLAKVAQIHLRWTDQLLDDDPRKFEAIRWTTVSDDAIRMHANLELQTCSLLSFGLIYMDSRHRTLSKRFLAEIFRRGFACTIDVGAIKLTQTPAVKTRACYDEAYALAAGIALGLCNLAAGTEYNCGLYGADAATLFDCLSPDAPIRDRTKAVLHDRWFVTPAALMAISLMYLRTVDEGAMSVLSSQLQCTDTPMHLLLLTQLTYLLIQWPDFEAANVSSFAAPFLAAINEQALRCSLWELQRMASKLVGFLLYTGIRFAGTRNGAVVDCLHSFLHKFNSSPSILLLLAEAGSFSAKCSKQAVCLVYDNLLLSLSLVLAGSGDVLLWRTLRSWWRDPLDFSPQRSRLHHTALGFLCSQYKFTAESSRSIAFLLISLWPSDTDDFQHAVYCRYLRHWWLLCAEKITKSLPGVEAGTLQSIDIALHGLLTPLERARLKRAQLYRVANKF